MRYFCVSDIHGQYTKLIEALANAGFDMEKDTLINVGDSFDRGPENQQVLDFLMSLPHRILIWGNHDRRLRELACGDFIAEFDFHNGTNKTIKDFAPQCDNVWSAQRALINNQPLWDYFRECHFAVEFPDLIITHAWVPYFEDYVYLNSDEYQKSLLNGSLGYDPNIKLVRDWRNARLKEWDDCCWGRTDLCVKKKAFPDKKILVGHWHAFDIAEKCGVERISKHGGKNPWINCSTFELEDKAIFIDGCSNYEKGGCVNVYVFESDAEPQFIFQYQVK